MPIPECDASLLAQLTLNADATTPTDPDSTPSSVPRYPFSKLSVGSIRLLRLHPHLDKQCPLQCDLFDYPLTSSTNGTHLYEALSYVWGCGEKSQLLSTGHGGLPITENLYVALLSLRDRSFPRVIWVDAICINQHDTEERSRQVQYMAEIYARASRVIVWLEEISAVALDTTVSNPVRRAFNTISNAANGRLESSTNEADRQAVHGLFQQPWFERIWVLQEVAAARHVLIMCHGMEIDGYAFCEGINALNLPFEDQVTQSRIGSAVYLIKGAGLRPKQFVGRANRLSLDICTLGELVDMYHSRKATDSRDKVYALLGMSSDAPANLSPNYGILWRDLFHRLIHHLTSDKVTVKTWDDEEIAVIHGKGYALGKVSWASDADLWDGTQDIQVDLYLRNKTHHTTTWRRHWHLRASADSIRAGDIVCLLQGASVPAIIRPCQDYCVIIALAVAAVDTTPKPRRHLDWPSCLTQIDNFNHDMVLVWDWEMSQQGLQDRYDYQQLLVSRAQEGHIEATVEDPFQEANRVHSLGLLLTTVERYDEAAHKFHQAVSLFIQATSRELHLETLAKVVPVVGGESKLQREAMKWRVMADIMGQQGSSADSTELGIRQIAPGLDEGMVGQILNWHREQFVVLGDVVLAAAGNDKGCEVLKLLLERFGKDIVITEDILRATAWSECGGDMMEVLLYRGHGDNDDDSDNSYDSDEGGQSQDSSDSDNSDDSISYQTSDSNGSVKFELYIVTEAILLAIANNPSQGGKMMDLLLDKCERATVLVSAKVVEVTAGNSTSGQQIMDQFLRRDICQLEITEDVAKTVVSNESWDVDIIELFLTRYGGQIDPSEGVVAAAAGNMKQGDKVVELLISLYGRRVDTGPEVRRAAAQNPVCGTDVMRLLKEAAYV